MDMETEIERVVFFQGIRKAAEAACAENPMDVDNLTKWGSALLGLSSYHWPGVASKMIEDAISKFEEALLIDPTKSETHWCLGNALTVLGFLTCYSGIAETYFSQATDHFKTASEIEPCNPLFRKSLEMAAKAPELRAKIFPEQPTTTAAGPSSSSTRAATKKEKDSFFKRGIIGLVILVVSGWLLL